MGHNEETKNTTHSLMSDTTKWNRHCCSAFLSSVRMTLDIQNVYEHAWTCMIMHEHAWNCFRMGIVAVLMRYDAYIKIMHKISEPHCLICYVSISSNILEHTGQTCIKEWELSLHTLPCCLIKHHGWTHSTNVSQFHMHTHHITPTCIQTHMHTHTVYTHEYACIVSHQYAYSAYTRACIRFIASTNIQCTNLSMHSLFRLYRINTHTVYTHEYAFIVSHQYAYSAYTRACIRFIASTHMQCSHMNMHSLYHINTHTWHRMSTHSVHRITTHSGFIFATVGTWPNNRGHEQRGQSRKGLQEIGMVRLDLYIYIYIYICIHTYTYIHMHMHIPYVARMHIRAQHGSQYAARRVQHHSFLHAPTHART